MDGDDIPDIILRNNNTGTVRVWTMNHNFTRKSNRSVIGSSNTNLEIRGVVDIDGDGNNDILNYNTITGVLRAWLMNGNLGILDNARITQWDNLDWSVRSGTNYQYSYPDKPIPAKPYIDVVVDDKVVDFGRLDSWRRNLGAFASPFPIDLPDINQTNLILQPWPFPLPEIYPNYHPIPFGNFNAEGQMEVHLIRNWGVYSNFLAGTSPLQPLPPAVQGITTATNDLKRLPTIPAPDTNGHFNPIQYPDGMTLVYAIVADADGDPINAEFVLPEPIMGRGNFYTAIDLDMEGGVPAGTLIDSYETLAVYNDMLTRYANLGWLPIQSYQISPFAVLPYSPPPIVLPLNPLFISPIEPTALIVYPLDNLQNPVTFIKEPKEFPYIIGFKNGSEKISAGDIVTEAINPVTRTIHNPPDGLIPQGKVHKVILVSGSWADASAKGYLWMIPVMNDFWDWRYTDAAIPTLFLNQDPAAIVSYVGQVLPIIWEAPDDPDIEETTHDRRHVNPDAIPRGGVINIEARVTDNLTPQQKDFDWVAYPTDAYAYCHDVDKDGYFAETGCNTEVDCNDENPDINPGATEICDDKIDNDCNGKIDCSDTACTDDPACTHKGKVWKLVKTIKLGDYLVEKSSVNYNGDPCEVHDSYTVVQNTINYRFYHKGKGCTYHIDITGSIEFTVPPSYAYPNEEISLNLSGSIGGYKSGMMDGVWYSYYKENTWNKLASTLSMSIANCGDPKEVTADGVTFQGDECSYTDTDSATYTFPGEYSSSFSIYGRGNRGTGWGWHYELVNR